MRGYGFREGWGVGLARGISVRVLSLDNDMDILWFWETLSSDKQFTL